MFKIGEFSKITQVSVRMLRYYDENYKQSVEYCDWKIELGPGAGKDGGNVISQGAV